MRSILQRHVVSCARLREVSNLRSKTRQAGHEQVGRTRPSFVNHARRNHQLSLAKNHFWLLGSQIRTYSLVRGCSLTHGNLSSGKNKVNSQPKIVYSKTTVNNSPSTTLRPLRPRQLSSRGQHVSLHTSATCRLRKARLRCAVHVASPAKAVAARRRSKIDQSPRLRRCVSVSKVCWLTIGHIDDLLCFSCRLRTSNQRSQRPSKSCWLS